MARSELRPIDQFIADAAAGKMTRRELVARGAALGLSASAIGMALRATPEAAFAQAAEPAGQIVISLSAEPATLENWNAYSLDGHPVLRNIFEALLNRDPATNELVGELATAWEWTDDRTLRFTLREGVTFHDGSPFNAQVAADGVNFTWSAENAFDITQFMGPQISAAVVDEVTIDVSAAEPDPILPARLYFAPLPNMVQVEERPDSLPNEAIGTGPYQLVEWVRGDHISLTAYPEWWGNGDPEAAFGQQSIKDVQYVWRPESTVRAAQVTAGEAQIARFLAPDDCETTPVCLEAPSVETIFLRLDTMHPVMGDIRIREAIGLAVDKESLVEQIFGGGQVAAQLVGPSAVGHNEELTALPYDMERAQQLVQEAAADGVPVDMEITVAVRQGAYPRNEELGEYVANQLNEIGLNARTEVIEHAAYQEQYVMPYDEIPTDRGWIGTLGHGNEMMDVSQTFSGYYRCDGGVSTFCDPEIDAMTAEAAVVTGEERNARLAEVTAAFMERIPVIPIVHLPFFYGVAADLNWQPRLDAFMLVKEMSYTS
ncbi:MAG: peptide/nickel transporter substrate-binding lipoprotein [Thermomicrobiales bacterium]|jgi:peptide/nickel transport system substrate-binding protein|nr:peptide/nickel transporter substrate-binding lipoprotein [Thermomicrobiales bacterium]